ncbi:hypothetical protein G3R49_04020 [Shewanella sp. WXL01]|uniref:hypothetical protein n=1 Tax=Shewanella sp. WXL01 TaxID=2709721 RepID=UPI0014385722|nr:hypothetical protein [Shewanella sp. WXL01]NKF49743.1 hypothetical protein [Shewanella sp. WXL01]
MRYGSIALALVCLYASNSYAALEVITSSEKNTLKDIERQYNIDPQLISVNDKFSRHNKKANDIEELKKKIESEKARYEELVGQLQDKILAKANMPAFYRQIEDTVNGIDSLETRTRLDTQALEGEREDIQAEYKSINAKRSEKSQKLFKLKKDITDRLVADLSKSSSELPVNINGSTECSKFQSIADCLKESKSYILSNTRNESPFLTDKSVLLDYEVLDANMNMHGELNYKVAMKFKPSYNKKIDSIINEELGLKSAMITLVSNVDADWYINGNKVGTGKKLFHEIPLGKHGILASYQSEDKSSVEDIEGNGVFNYNFDKPQVANSVERLPEQPKQAEKAKPKAKYTLFSDNTSMPKGDAKKVTTEKGYEYFMGVKPSTKKQVIEFTNEPTEK